MTTIDSLITHFDRMVRTLLAPAKTVRPVPGNDEPEAELSESERRHAAALMRVNHCGEVCAQALYQGQAFTCRDPYIASELRRASQEEGEHLAWTEVRIAELGGRKSILNPVWYAGSFLMGAAVGRLGDSWNLGFLVETERQVEAHLKGHLRQLPPGDRRSREIVEHMQRDEARHGNTAKDLGARDLPWSARQAMKLASRVMTTTSYWV